jgi:transcription elongation factor Elf1
MNCPHENQQATVTMMAHNSKMIKIVCKECGEVLDCLKVYGVSANENR